VPAQVESKSGNSSFDDGQEPEDDIIHDLLSKLEPPKVCWYFITLEKYGLFGICFGDEGLSRVFVDSGIRVKAISFFSKLE
jgi:hypothetical protein